MRDPVLLGERLLNLRELSLTHYEGTQPSLSSLVDLNGAEVDDYRDPEVLEKYPRNLA